MNIRLSSATFFLIIFAFFAVAPFASAEGLIQGAGNSDPVQGGGNVGVRLVNPLGTTSVQDFLIEILNIVTDLIGPVVVILMLVYVGFLFVTARGNTTQISSARTALLWTVVGALILLGAKAIALGIQATVAALKV